MEEQSKYVFDKITGILYKYYSGPITLEDISASWDYAIANNIIPPETKGFILDYRKASIQIEIAESYKIADYYRQHLEVFGNKKIAIIIQDHKDFAIPTLVASRDDGYSSYPFSTLEAAINWVLG
jgi:hypothetical protein